MSVVSGGISPYSSCALLVVLLWISRAALLQSYIDK